MWRINYLHLDRWKKNTKRSDYIPLIAVRIVLIFKKSEQKSKKIDTQLYLCSWNDE